MFFYNKGKILTIFFIVKYEKITLFDVFLALSGPITVRFFACSNEEKNKQKQQRVLALVLSPLPTKSNLCRQGREPILRVEFCKGLRSSRVKSGLQILD